MLNSILCIFLNDRLVDIKSNLPDGMAAQLIENAAFQLNMSKELLSCVKFEDSQINLYFSHGRNRPSKKIVFSKTKASLIDIIKTQVPTTGKLNWRNCTPEQISEHFSPEEQSKIQQNIDYFNSLGEEKFNPSFEIQWPQVITEPEVPMFTSITSEVITKEIDGIVLI
jgi:hypothetical protein